MAIDLLLAVSHKYPGDKIVRYPDGRITRNGAPLTPVQVNAARVEYQSVQDAADAAAAAIEAAEAARQADKQAIRTATEIRNLINASPAQIDARIDAAVTDITSAKTLLKILAKAISAIGRDQFVD